MKDSLIKNFLVNLRALFTVNIRRRLNEDSAKITQLESTSDSLEQTITERFHYLNILDYYARHEAESQTYQKELDYLRLRGTYCNFPYTPDTTPLHVVSGFDQDVKLPFVIHKNKKLFFKATLTPTEALNSYKNYIQTERLLGVEDIKNTPHQYQSPRVHVTEGDVVFDIGAAEGLFALDQIEKASHIVIVESDIEWIAPLTHTFAPYGDKVTIIQKFVSATDTETTISLRKLLSLNDYSSAFVKMDIEGYELTSVAAAADILKQREGIKLSITSYHKQHDAEKLKSFFEGLNYNFEFSRGYMLFHLYDTLLPPYFRHGLIRAFK